MTRRSLPVEKSAFAMAQPPEEPTTVSIVDGPEPASCTLEGSQRPADTLVPPKRRSSGLSWNVPGSSRMDPPSGGRVASALRSAAPAAAPGSAAVRNEHGSITTSAQVAGSARHVRPDHQRRGLAAVNSCSRRRRFILTSRLSVLAWLVRGAGATSAAASTNLVTSTRQG